MATSNDLVTRALRSVGVLGAGQTADANDVSDGLDIMNDILQQWILEDLMLYTPSVISHALTTLLTTYTIGPSGAAWTAARPIEILSAYVRTNNNLDISVEIVSFDTYQLQIQKQWTSGTYPTMLAYQPTNPNGTIYLWPTPSTNLTLFIQTNNQFISYGLGEVVDLPPGYNKALVDSLSYELCLVHGRTEMLDQIKERALLSKMVIKRKNVKKNILTLDSAFLQSNDKPYNVFTDQ